MANCSYPIHYAVWNNDIKEVKKLLQDTDKANIERIDIRGRTPLMLAIKLGHNECASLLMMHNANVNMEDNSGFNVLHEAVSTGNPDLVNEVLERRDYQRYSGRVDGIPLLLKKIRDTQDFYVEMTWEFSSWVPLISRMCPSDTYKIYKSGSNVRIDTTLLGFDQTNWQRGSRSYIFKGEGRFSVPKFVRCNRSYIFKLSKSRPMHVRTCSEEGAIFLEVDHDLQQVHVESMKVIPPEFANSSSLLKPTPEMVQTRLSSPITITYIDPERISFERAKAGIIGFRTDKSEVVNGYDCKVFTANNVEVVTRTRTEHMGEEEKLQHKANNVNRLTPFQSLLGMVETEEKPSSTDVSPSTSMHGIYNPKNITAEQYFDENFELNDNDIGRPREMTTKVQKFKANLWLCEDYPLSLPEQVLPIVDLMAISSSHFAKLRDFINLQLPSGFPVKIEIPLFHVLNARITFGNIFSLDQPVDGVTRINDETLRACVVDESCFEPPSFYKKIGTDEMRQWSLDDEELVNMAIQQYLIEEGTESEQVTFWEALKAQQPDADLQRAIQESLTEYHQLHPPSNNNSGNPYPNTTNIEEDAECSVPMVANGHIPNETDRIRQNPEGDWNQTLQLALRLSQLEKEAEDKRIKEEEEMLEQVLKLSLNEK